HDYIHEAIGGRDGFMRHPEDAARDPIFWVHHSNTDRLWVEWLSANNANPDTPEWRNQTFTFFDEKANKQTVAVKDLLSMKALNYAYDVYPDDPAMPASADIPEMDHVVTLSRSAGG